MPAAVEKAGAVRRSVLWLNDLESYVGSVGLTSKHLIELVAGPEHHRVIVATLRASEEERLTAAGDEGRQVQREHQAVLDQAHRIFMDRHFNTAEQERAQDLAGEDPRIGDALEHAGTYGIAASEIDAHRSGLIEQLKENCSTS